jgi:DNA-binding MarR family transcriptional regulator
MSAASRRPRAATKALPRARARTPAGDAFSALVVQILEASGRLLIIGDELAGPAGLTSARWRVLAAVEDVPLHVADVARMLGLARQSVQRVADLLTRERLATFTANPAHRRAKLLRLTPAGHRALAIIAASQHVWANRLGQAIGPARVGRAEGHPRGAGRRVRGGLTSARRARGASNHTQVLLALQTSEQQLPAVVHGAPAAPQPA